MTIQAQRRMVPQEQIDSLSLSEADTDIVFSQLHLINKLTLNHYLVRKALRYVLSAAWPDKAKEVHIVDLGSGPGDQLFMMKRSLARSGYRCRATGIDFNPQLILKAQQKYGHEPDMDFIRADVMSDAYIIPECDVLISSQFLYRFTDEELSSFLKRNGNRLRKALIISEINRDAHARFAFPIIGKMMGWHPVIIDDGRVALEKAWQKNELQKLVQSTGLFRKVRARNLKFRYTLTCHP